MPMDKKSVKILIVDDEENLSLMLKEYFVRQGYQVDVACDGEEGLTKTKEVNPDLILLDVLMPILDGISMLKELKSDSSTSGIPVIMLTNLDTKDKMEEAQEMGVFHYLVKLNYSPKDLDMKIQEILNMV